MTQVTILPNKVIKGIVQACRKAYARRVFRRTVLRSQRKLKKNRVVFGNDTYGNDVHIYNNGQIILGEKVFLNSFPNGSCHRTALNTYCEDAEIQIGHNCRINGTIIHCNERVTIGHNCMFGPGTVIVDNDSHRISAVYEERINKPESDSIHIGNNVWIGMNCIVLKGVKIGDNSIVAAGSVLTKDMPPNTLWGGIPARQIKTL